MDAFRKRWETKTTEELQRELERRLVDSKQQAQSLKRTEEDPNYRGLNLAERWQELAEDGMIIGQLRDFILERQMRHVREHQKILPPDILLTPLELQEQLGKGLQYVKTRDFREALEVFNKIIDHERESWEAYYYRGWVLAELQQREAADEDFATVIQMKSDYVEAYIKRATMWDYFPKQGIPAYTALVHIDPKNAHAHYKLGWMLYMEKRYVEAITSSSEAIQLKPDFEYSYHTRLCCYFEIGEYEKALADCETHIQRFSSHKAMQYHIDRIRQKMAEL